MMMDCTYTNLLFCRHIRIIPNLRPMLSTGACVLLIVVCGVSYVTLVVMCSMLNHGKSVRDTGHHNTRIMNTHLQECILRRLIL